MSEQDKPGDIPHTRGIEPVFSPDEHAWSGSDRTSIEQHESIEMQQTRGDDLGAGELSDVQDTSRLTGVSERGITFDKRGFEDLIGLLLEDWQWEQLKRYHEKGKALSYKQFWSDDGRIQYADREDFEEIFGGSCRHQREVYGRYMSDQEWDEHVRTCEGV